MKKMLPKILPCLAGASFLVSTAFSQTVHINDSFDDALNYGYWTVGKGTDPENYTRLTADPDGTSNNSLWIKGGNLARTYTDGWSNVNAVPSDEDPLIWQVRLYDYMDEPEGATGVYAELRSIHGESWQATLFAVGVFESPYTNYQFRMYPTQGWVTLDTPRSEGWHTFTFVIRGDTFDLYVDEDPLQGDATPHPAATNLRWAAGSGASPDWAFEGVHLGGASSRTGEAFLFDDLYLANDPAFAPAVEFIEQPSPRRSVREFGESITYTVTATGLQPLSYQWLLDGAPLVDDARISGAQTDTLTINGTDGIDSGNYSVRVTDAQGADRTSTSAQLVALVEHELIMNAMDLTADDFQGDVWGTYSTTDGWFGWIGANTANVLNTEGEPNPERLAIFTPTITQAGWYEVWTYFVPSYSGWGNNRTNEAPYHVNHVGGEDLVFINQQHPSGPSGTAWVHVGTYEFTEGTDGNVAISNLRKGPSGDGGSDGTFGSIVIADAMRFIPTEAPPTDAEGPTVTISRSATGEIELLIEGEPATEYTIESADNLGDSWASLGSEVTDASGNATFTDSAAGDAPRRFYRIVLP